MESRCKLETYTKWELFQGANGDEIFSQRDPRPEIFTTYGNKGLSGHRRGKATTSKGCRTASSEAESVHDGCVCRGFGFMRCAGFALHHRRATSHFESGMRGSFPTGLRFCLTYFLLSSIHPSIHVAVVH